jgi:LysM repeat protein
VLGIALSGLMVPALLGTNASPTEQQIADSAWLAQLEPPRAYAATLPSDCPGCGPLLTGLASPAAAPAAADLAPASEQVEAWATMVVRDGDTLSELAAWFGITAEEMALANGVSVEDFLVAGSTIAIPIPQSQFLLPPVPVVYVLEPETEPEPDPAPVLVVASVPTIAPAPARPAYTGTSNDVIAAICSLPWPCDTMVRIAMCESGLNPASLNPAGYYGLYQINVAIAGWDDPWTNASYAYNSKYAPAAARGDGLTPWPHCRNY